MQSAGSDGACRWRLARLLVAEGVVLRPAATEPVRIGRRRSGHRRVAPRLPRSLASLKVGRGPPSTGTCTSRADRALWGSQGGLGRERVSFEVVCSCAGVGWLAGACVG